MYIKLDNQPLGVSCARLRPTSQHDSASYSVISRGIQCIYTVSQKTKQICFCQNFVNFPQISIIFDRKMGNDPNICEVHSFSTSLNLRHHLTVLNANVPNCYITPNVVLQ